MSWIKEIMPDVRALNFSDKTIRNFGLVFAGMLGLIGGLIYWKSQTIFIAKWLWGIGLLFLVFGFILPSVLRPFYTFWMFLSFVIGGVVSRIILTLLFFVVMTPIGLLMRLIGKDLLKEKFDRNSDESYWVKKDEGEVPVEQYKKMY